MTMKEKLTYLFFSFLFLLLSLLAIENHSYLNYEQSPILVPVIIFLVLFSATILFLSKNGGTIRYFRWIIFLISIYLVCERLPFSFFTIISFILISFLSYFVYNFFTTFNSIPVSPILKRIKKCLFSYSLVTSFLLLINFERFYWLILLEIILSIFSCMVLYSKNKDLLSTKTRKEQTFLIKSLIVSISPLILSYSTKNSLWSSQLKFCSLFFVLLLPITVSIILIKRNDIHLNKVVIAVNFITHSICILLVCSISRYILHFSLFKIYFIIVFYCFVLYVFYLKNWCLKSLELKRVQHTKNEFQMEKLDLIQIITKEKTLASISSLISKLLMQNYGISSYIVIWKDLYNPYILSFGGAFSNITLTNTVIDELEGDSTLFRYQNNEFAKFTFCKNDQVLGWLIVNKDKHSKLAVIEYKSINDLVSIIGEIILENEKLYDIKQEALQIESLSYDEYVNYKYLNMVQNFHKDFSLFIHDNVLQNILALKKLTESMRTEHIETKRLIVEKFDTLNEVFRNKIVELYPPSIEKAPLSQSIRILCDKLNNEHYSIFINFYCPQETQLKKEKKFHIYRITQELIVNSLKHSHASEIIVSLIQNEFYIETTVQDNGIGFDYRKIELREFEHNFFGLLSIKQEVNSLNGQMKISPVMPHGTKFTITLPTAKEDLQP